MAKYRIAVVAADERVGIGFKNQLESIFHDEMEIVVLSIEDEQENFLGFDLIMAASSAIYDEVKKKAPLNAKIITVIRNINILELHKVLDIEAGAKALVVSNFFYAAKETVDLLKEIGLNHIKYIPYSPGTKLREEELESIDLAITAGAYDYVPKKITRIIDLGLKVIDISTIVEVILHLGLPLEKINLFSQRYMKEFISLNKKISDLKSTLIAVLNASTDGIMALDLNSNVIFKNNKIETYLGTDKKIREGDNIAEFIDNANILNFIKSYEDKGSDVFNINKRDVMINKSYLSDNKKVTGTVVSFNYVSEIQNKEKEIRKKLVNKGNVAKYDFSDVIGCSKSIKSVTEMTRKVAKTDLSVLILGENGTGKELYAQAIHRNSSRRDGPFVAVNFAALPESLAESELFGYEEGAFTGAKKGGKRGLFELAHLGTIFLDEIGDASLSIQASLLRVIQEKEVLRIGGTSPVPVDVRIIAATNRNLKEMIKLNQFRQDLYYRLNTITIKVPPLRERKEDIKYIIDYYMKNLKVGKKFTKEALDKLIEYDWPGNVRELENLIHYVAEIVDDDVIDVDDLPIDIAEGSNMIEEDDTSVVNIIKSLENICSLAIFKSVLEELEIADDSYIRASRAYLLDKLLSKGIKTTDSTLRKALKELDKWGFINVGSTRQGTRINQRGKTFLSQLKTINGNI